MEPAADKYTSPHAAPLDDFSSETSTASDADALVPVVEQTPLEVAQELLKADYDELMNSGLDFSSSIKEIDLMAEEERYGEFGKR